MKKVLIVLPSHNQLGDTGFWLEEFTSPYYEFIDNGYDATIASPKGGNPPVDPKSVREENQTDSTRRFEKDRAAQERLANTLILSHIQRATTIRCSYRVVTHPYGIYQQTRI